MFLFFKNNLGDRFIINSISSLNILKSVSLFSVFICSAVNIHSEELICIYFPNHSYHNVIPVAYTPSIKDLFKTGQSFRIGSIN